MIPNPYTLRTTLSADFCWLPILESKNGFFFSFRIPLSSDSQELFACKWEGLDTRVKKRVLLDTTSWGAGGWFKNSPTMFGEILAKDLRDLPLKKGSLLQYCG